MMYTWNSKSNSFDGYEPQYEERTDENGKVERIEISCDKTLYTQEQVDAIFAGRGANQVIKDLDGVPTAVDLYTESELAIADGTGELGVCEERSLDHCEPSLLGAELEESRGHPGCQYDEPYLGRYFHHPGGILQVGECLPSSTLREVDGVFGWDLWARGGCRTVWFQESLGFDQCS